MGHANYAHGGSRGVEIVERVVVDLDAEVRRVRPAVGETCLLCGLFGLSNGEYAT